MRRRCVKCHAFLVTRRRGALCSRCRAQRVAHSAERLHVGRQQLPHGSWFCNLHVACEKRKAWPDGDSGSTV